MAWTWKSPIDRKVEKNKDMETKQYASKKSVVKEKKLMRKSENKLRQIKMETQYSKIYGIYQKQF